MQTKVYNIIKKIIEKYMDKIKALIEDNAHLDTNKASRNIHLLKKESITAVKSSQDI